MKQKLYIRSCSASLASKEIAEMYVDDTETGKIERFSQSVKLNLCFNPR